MIRSTLMSIHSTHSARLSIPGTSFPTLVLVRLLVVSLCPLAVTVSPFVVPRILLPVLAIGLFINDSI